MLGIIVFDLVSGSEYLVLVTGGLILAPLRQAANVYKIQSHIISIVTQECKIHVVIRLEDELSWEIV